MDKDNGGTNIQDGYLGRARKERAWLTVVLNSGKKVVGRIRSFDRYTLILEDRGSEQMIFKHAIATIATARAFANPIRLGGSEANKDPSGRASGSDREEVQAAHAAAGRAPEAGEGG